MLEIILRAYFGAQSLTGWECAMECASSGRTYSVMCNLLLALWPTVTSGNIDNTT